MKVINYKVEIKESVEQLKAVEKQQIKAEVLHRVQLMNSDGFDRTNKVNN